MFSKKVEFLKAIPVWAEGLEKEINRHLMFNTTIDFSDKKRYYLSCGYI